MSVHSRLLLSPTLTERQVIGLLRSASEKLRKNESISLNAISPGPVNTSISDVLKEVVPTEHFTTMSVILDALDKILDEDITGQVFECSSQKFYLREPVEYCDKSAEFLLQDMKRF